MTAAQASAVVADPWRVIADSLRAAYRTDSMVLGAQFITKVVDAAEQADHHPDIELRYGCVYLTLTTHSAQRLTQADVALADTITEIAATMGLVAVPPAEKFELAIDALDIAAIRPFWKTILGYRDGPNDELAELTDPGGLLPPVWFQQMEEPRPQRSRMHVDLWIPHDAVDERIAAAVAAGGRLLTDEYAPAFWVLADSEGNEICLCTWQGRSRI